MQQPNNLMDVGFLKCFHQHQNNSSLYLSLDNKQRFEDRLFCEDCFKSQISYLNYLKIKFRIQKLHFQQINCNYQAQINIISSNKIIKQKFKYNTSEAISLQKLIALILEEKNNQQKYIYFSIQLAIEQINKFSSHVHSFKLQFLDLFDKINLNCNLWKEELLFLNQKASKFDLLLELQQFEIIEDDLKIKSYNDINKQLTDINCYHYQTVEYCINEIENNIRDEKILIEFQRLLKQVDLQNIDNQQTIKSNKQIKFNLATELTQENWCGVIAFNKQGSIMVSGYDQDIKVWKLKESLPIGSGHILNGHSNQVYSIVFSKKFNWFISGCSGDDKLISWKESRNSDQWEFFKTSETVSTVWCLILSEKENQLFSSHDDGSIGIWAVSYLNNQMIFEYSLQMHNSFVYQISLNESQNSLVSCSEDKQIIVWKLGKTLIWQFGYIIQKSMDDYGQRITFINNDTIVWISNQGHIHIFQLNDSNFVENKNLQILPNKITQSDHYNLFPLIFIKSQNILMLKHCQNVYLLRYEVNKQFKIIGEPISFESACMFGNLNVDGSSLVVWNIGTKSFRFYSLDYF